MGFLYHARPPDMVGERLYPLHQLAAISPSSYELQVSKYVGREWVLDSRDPVLGLRWNDFLHCSTIHPRLIFQANMEAGSLDPALRGGPRLFTGPFFQIPLERIAGLPALRYEATDLSGPPEHFSMFDAEAYEELEQVPQAYREYLNRSVQEGNLPLLYFTIPHVLIAGSIETADLTLIDWAEPLPG